MANRWVGRPSIGRTERYLMQSTVAAIAAAAGLVAGTFAADAGEACRSERLGVSRTITIDTMGGKLYGGLQYKSSDLLKDGEVILTFDDGPLRPYTRKVLDALASHCTRATFFMVGRMAVADPKMVRSVEAAGHTIANHTWSHRNLYQRSARRAGGEIELGISAVQLAATKPISPFFRFPYLADPKSMIAYANERNLAVFSIDIDSNDYKTSQPERVYSNIMKQLRSRRKGIILFHDIQRSTAYAMQRLLDDMHREGFKVVHMVSKTPVKTIQDFDLKAAELHLKRRTVASAPSAAGGDYEKLSGKSRQTSAKKPARAAAVPAAPVASQPAAVRIAQPRRRKSPDQDWRRSIWGN